MISLFYFVFPLVASFEDEHILGVKCSWDVSTRLEASNDVLRSATRRTLQGIRGESLCTD